MLDVPPLAVSVFGAFLGVAGSIVVRLYGAEKSSAAKLLGEVVQRLEKSQNEAIRRIADIEARLRELEVEQGRSGAHQAALDARLIELRTDFRAASEKLDTISQLLAAIRSQLELLTPAPARTLR